MSELFKLVGTIAIETEDATSKIEAVVTAGEDLEAKLNGIGANADNSIGANSGFAAASVWLGNTITELTRRAAQLGKEFVVAGLQYNAAMEGYEVSFGTLLNGDMEKAKKLMADITAFALESPLNVSGVSAAALQLLNVGTAYEDVIPMLKMLGDLSLGDASKMDRLSVALSQVMGFGQLYGQEKQQFVNAGVPIYKLLEDYYKIVEGMDVEGLDLDSMQRGGNITSEHVFGALQLATMSDEEILAKYGYSGERAVSFYNAMAAMLPTYTGQMQKAGEQTEIAAGAVVSPYQDKATESVLPAYAEMMAALAKKYEDDKTEREKANVLGDFLTNSLNALTDALSGKFDVTVENEENLSPFGKLVAGVYDLDDFLKSLLQIDVDTEEDDGETGQYNDPDFFTYTPGENDSSEFFKWEDYADGLGGNSGGEGGSIPGLIGAVQALIASNQSVKGDVTSAIAEGLSGVTITGTITTGDVTLDSGTIVGEIAPQVDLKLGTANALASRG